MINIVIPMAGAGSRFAQAGYEKPKPFIDVAGKPMIVRVLENLTYPHARYILIAREEHLQQERELVTWIEKNHNVIFVTVQSLTEGTACTVLYARSIIRGPTPVVIANSDQIIDIKFEDFINDAIDRKLDGSILTFIDEERNPKWSFAKLSSDNLVTEVREKQPISSHATVGIYLFSDGEDFIESIVQMIIENDRVNGEFYTCPTYNYLIRRGLRIGVFNIKSNQMHGIGTPSDLESYINSNLLATNESWPLGSKTERRT
jgi:NDP-sugar pyrophosphorylase family protein